MRDDLSPSGKCMGPTMKGCPDGADVLPSEEVRSPGVTVRTMRYHCPKCLEIYRRRYSDAMKLADEERR